MSIDIEIAQKAELKPVKCIAERLGINPEYIETYGKYKAKLPLSLIDEEKIAQSALILVTAISPTPAGEGKTTVSIGLAQAFSRLNKKSVVVLREPSLGPVFGIKGGATGGGYSQLLPMEDINLHFTGDFSAVEKANNLLAALIDNNIQSKRRSLNIDPRTVTWKRVVDMNDRSLRHILIGLGGTTHGVPRETGFNITAASEIMAILCLASGVRDLKRRLGNIFVGFTFDGNPVFARDLNAHGAMATLLKDALKPNLVQTIEGTPAIVHGGPFANIAQGTNSILATKMGMSFAEYVVTEAGFGSDLGAEKFIDIKCRFAGIAPKAVVIVATIRALRYHGGGAVNVADADAVKRGVANLEKHIENMKLFGIVPVVAVNRFTNDSEAETDVVIDLCRQAGVKAVIVDVWSKGGEGALELAQTLTKTVKENTGAFKFLYDEDLPVEEKIDLVAKTIYGATGVEYSAKALSDLKKVHALGLGKLPVCIAKTQKSLSDQPSLIGRPSNFAFHIREVGIAAGAGFVIPVSGEITAMPGLPEKPAAEQMDIDDGGKIAGLF